MNRETGAAPERRIGRPGEQHTATVVLFGAGIFALLPISTDLYLPALPAIRAAFADPGALAQLTLSAFIVGFGAGHLIMGPLSDRYGRRPLLLAGLTIYVLASIGCALAPSIEALVASRLVQGIGCCSGSVLSRAIIRDLYDPQRGAHVFALITVTFTVVPMFAPLFGGWLTASFGWRANFIGLIAFSGLVLAATWMLLGETNVHRDPAATDPARLARNYRLIVCNPVFLGYTLCCMFSYAGLFTYLSLSPFVLIDGFGVPAQRYGLWFMLGVAGHACGALACNRLVRRIPIGRLVVISSSVTGAGAFLMLALAGQGIAHPAAVMGPMVLYLFGHGITSPLCMTSAVGPFPKLAGTASALFGFILSAVAAVVGHAAMRLHDGTAWALAWFVALSAACLLVTAVVAGGEKLKVKSKK
ncbi:MAG: multidrug effflux MFS transporter [Gammaproteobacteria bacterium]|nr:multidrug effflux MFS transporter [Gammaproteobacteria bacterium]